MRTASKLPSHLVIISDQSVPIGGAEIIALQLAETMAAAGIRVTFIAGDNATDCPLKRSEIEVIALSGSPIGNHSPLARSAAGIHNRAGRALIDGFIAARDTASTIYHVHNWSKIFSPSIFRALAQVSSRLLVSAHDYSLVCPNIAYSDYQNGGQACPRVPLGAACLTTNCDRKSYLHKLWRVARSVERRMAINFAETDALVSIIHPDMSEYFTRAGIPHDRLRVVRNPVTPYAGSRVEAELNEDLFFIGRVAYEKGVDLAAEAARMAGRRLRVVGDGDMREDLAVRYPEVVFEGWKSHGQIGALITQARALLVPSRLPEAFTLVAHEAMRSGVPVITFADVDCREAAEIGAALAVPPRQSRSLAAAIRSLDSPEAVSRMSRVAFEQAHRFSNTTDTWREALLVLYSELIGGRDAPHHTSIQADVPSGRVAEARLPPERSP